MKKYLCLLLVIVMVFSLTACSPGDKQKTEGSSSDATGEASESVSDKTSDTGAANTYDGVTLTLLTRYGDDTAVDAKVFREGLKEFETNHPEVKVVDNSVTDETQFNNLFKTAMATGDIPTLFMTYGGGTAQSYVESGLVKDITSYLNTDQEWYGSFIPSMFDMITYDEKIYGVPYAAYADSLYCNKAMFDQNGIAIPETIEEFEAACEEFLAKGITPIAVGDKSTFRGGHMFALLLAKRTGDTLVRKLASGEASYDSEEVKDVLTTMKSWADKGYLGDSITTLDGEGECQAFLTEKSPMDYRNGYFIGRIANEMNTPDNVVNITFPYYSEYPEYKDAWHGGSSDIFSISSSATEDETNAALELLKTCTQMKYMEERNKENAGGFIPVIKDAPDLAEQPLVAAGFKENFAKMTSMITEPAEYDPDSGLRDVTRNAIQAMWAGESVDDTVKAIMDEAILDDK